MKKNKKTMNVHMDVEDLKKLKVWAKKADMKRAELVRQIIKERLAQWEN